MPSDLRLALRQLVRQPAFSAAAILALSIGMAVTTVAFSAVNAFFFKGRVGTDVPGAGWVLGGGRVSDGGGEGISIPEFERLREATDGALMTAVEGRTPLAWRTTGHSETIWGLLVSSAYFDILDAHPLTGRLPGRGDAGGLTAVISERLWRTRLGAASVGALHLTLNGVDVPVIGVLADDFAGPGGLYAPDVWLPFEGRQRLTFPARLDHESTTWLTMIGRLAPEATVAEVQARLAAGAASIAATWPRTHAGRTATFRRFADRHPEAQAVGRLAAAGMSAVAVVLLLACFNVATLLLARGVDRARELGIRAAVGATRLRLVRLLVVEGLVLSTAAGLAAVVIASWSQSLLSAFAIPIAMPQRIDVAPDWRVIGAVAVMVLVAGVLPAAPPAWHAARLNLVRALTSQGFFGVGRPSAGRHGLMLLQVAGSTAFLALAALFVQSLVWTSRADLGFESSRAIVVSLDLPSQGYDAARSGRAVDQLLRRFRAVPGIAAAAAADRIPFYIGYPRSTPVSRTGAACGEADCPAVTTYAVGPGFFATMAIPMLSGHEWTAAAADAGGVVVSEALASEWFPNGNAVGQVIQLGGHDDARMIIGVARDTRHRSFVEPPRPVLYLPLGDGDFERPVTLVARTAGPAALSIRAIAQAIAEVDPGMAPELVTTMGMRLEMPRWPMQAASRFFGACGLLALVLATIGVAAVMSHSVSRRIRELGIRAAVGATRPRLIAGVLGSGLRLVVPGLALGLIGGWLLARSARAALIGIDIASPWTYLVVAVLQLAVALAACLTPALRAARVDPVEALRTQ